MLQLAMQNKLSVIFVNHIQTAAMTVTFLLRKKKYKTEHPH